MNWGNNYEPGLNRSVSLMLLWLNGSKYFPPKFAKPFPEAIKELFAPQDFQNDEFTPMSTMFWKP